MKFLKNIWALIPFVITVSLLLLFVPGTSTMHNVSKRTQCKSNLKQIMLALHNYHDDYGAFPPAYTTDSNGRPLHSWRTLILPYLDQQKLYATINLSKPWNDPANEEALKTAIPSYQCPGTDWAALKDSGNLTTYLAIVTPESCFPPGMSRSIREITDGTSNTLMIIEGAPQQAVPWMQPLDANELMVLKFGKMDKRPHKGGTHVAIADGSVKFLSENLKEEILRSLITVAGGEKVTEDY